MSFDTDNRKLYTPGIPPNGLDLQLREYLRREFKAIYDELFWLRDATALSWDDQVVQGNGISGPGAGGGPTQDTDSCWLFAYNLTQAIVIRFEGSHKWVQTKGVEFHIHWKKTTAAAGDVIWRMRWKAWNNGEVEPTSYSSWISTDARSHTIDATTKTLIDGWPEIDVSGYNPSWHLKVEVQRNTADPLDTYNADAKLEVSDIHVPMRVRGTLYEYSDER